jgi:GPH family glycoside/pentoside/hexuronide:cation symporter
VPLQRHVPGRVKFAFGFGAIAFGIKENGFSLLLVFYYNQVVGVPVEIVGSAVLLALVLDAFVDPMIGYISDHLKTPWGRRHPFLYFSAIPAGLFFLLLWNPPAVSGGMMFLWIFGIAFLVRATMSCFEVPMAALGPELTSDYHERTNLFGLRFFFAWFGGAAMFAFTFAVLLAPTPEYPNGQLNPAGYSEYAIIAAIIMSSVILISALGMHSEIKYLPRVENERETLFGAFRAIFRSFGRRAFLILMSAGIFANVAQGISFALTTYFITYFWELGTYALAWYTLALMTGIGGAVVASTAVSRRLGKRRASVAFLLAAVVIVPIPYIGRVLDFFPANGDPMLLPAILAFVAIGTGSHVAALILKSSMLTDVIEDDAERSGKRSEGLFFAGQFFVQKCVSGAGVAITSAVLWAVAFPESATPGEVGAPILQNLALVYCALIVALGIVAATIIARFPIEQADHEARIARLRGMQGAPVE